MGNWLSLFRYVSTNNTFAMAIEKEGTSRVFSVGILLQIEYVHQISLCNNLLENVQFLLESI